jgi:hypothetical protein
MPHFPYQPLKIVQLLPEVRSDHGADALGARGLCHQTPQDAALQL